VHEKGEKQNKANQKSHLLFIKKKGAFGLI